MKALHRTRLVQSLLCTMLVVLFAHSVHAQIVIQQQHVLSIFGPGTSHRYTEGIEGNINIGRTGGPNVYDFTAFSLANLGTSNNYQVSTLPQLVGRYPSTAVTMGDSPSTIEKNPVFLFGTDTAFVLGEASLVPQMRFKHHVPAEIMMVFPTSFGATISQTVTEYDTTFTSGGQVASANVSSSLEVTTVDGYGTLKIAGGQYECLRMKKAHNGYGDKEFIFMTREGVLVLVGGIPLSAADTGLVPGGAQILLANSVAAVENPAGIPEALALDQNYPNPFNPVTTIGFRVPAGQEPAVVSGVVKLLVYDLLGREVAVLVNATLEPGSYSVPFDASGLSSGLYLARLHAGGATKSISMLLVR